MRTDKAQKLIQLNWNRSKAQIEHMAQRQRVQYEEFWD